MPPNDSTGDAATSNEPPRTLKRAEDNVYYKLALKGKDVWNRWVAGALTVGQLELLGLRLQALPTEKQQKLAAELSATDLPDPKKIDFSNTDFTEQIDFHGFVFPGTADFRCSIFRQTAKFNAAIFAGHAWFDKVSFSHIADFDDTAFWGDAAFTGATFSMSANFYLAHFKNNASFSNAVFNDIADFEGTTPFASVADFSGKSQMGEDTDFSSRTFARATSFRGRSFKRAPKFHNATLHQDTDFGETDFNPIFVGLPPKGEDEKAYWSRTARAFRTLALAMNKAHAHEEEVRFFALEMRARERYETGARKWLIALYRWFGDYGQSIARPGLWLARAYALAFVINLALSKTLPACVAPSVVAECDRWAHLGKALAFTATSSVPFLGQARLAADMADKLFDPAMLPWVYAVSVVQGLASVVFIFLMGLALRNRFRIK